MQLKAHAVSVGLGLASGLFGLFAMARQPDAGIPAEWEEILSHMSIVYLDDGNGGQAKTIRISEVNVQLVNGLGGTPGNPFLRTDEYQFQVNSVGNLIVGYNELHPQGGLRTGSHNLIVGSGNNYSGYGGAAIGRQHTIQDRYCSVLGGTNNSAEGFGTTVAGGALGKVSGSYTCVAGGSGNQAHGSETAVFGGHYNRVLQGTQSSIHGGRENETLGPIQTIVGGSKSRIDTDSIKSMIVGGEQNKIVQAHRALIVGGNGNGIANGAIVDVFGGIGACFTDCVRLNAVGVRDLNCIEVENTWLGGDCFECSH